MPTNSIDLLWVLLCSGGVFLMQAGFLCLESGLTRSKNAISVAVKNLADCCVLLILFWGVGFAVMFGMDWNGLVGTSGFAVDIVGDHKTLTVFLFQAMFCATSTTIVSGAVAERMKFVAYLLVAVFVSGIVYPLFGHWAWGGLLGGPKGWLAERGFVDFAGATVVHGIGAWVALATLIVIGPRQGIYDGEDGKRTIQGSNLPIAMLGTLILVFGWLGFNGGSTLSFSSDIPRILAATLLSASSGGIAGLAASWAKDGQVDVRLAINGTLAGLVAVTAGCHAISASSAVLIGVVAAAVVYLTGLVLDRFRVDDAVGAVAVHGAAAIWGTLAVALVGDLEVLGVQSRGSLFLAQSLGILAACGLGFGFSLPVLIMLNRFMPFRVSAEDEIVGLNIAEHGASTEVLDLIGQMHIQRRKGEFRGNVPVDTASETGQIAAAYNRVMDTVSRKTELLAETNSRLQSEIEERKQLERERERLSEELLIVSRQAGMSEIANGVLHNIGNVLNSVNVSAKHIHSRVADSRLSKLEQLNELIQEHSSNLGEFVTADPRGQVVPRYLEQLVQAMRKDEAEIDEEVSCLLKRIDHIKDILGAQQSFARQSGVIQDICLETVVEEAITINAASLERHTVEVRKDFSDASVILTTEKAKVLQILTNLISNAKQAIEANEDATEKTILITTSYVDDWCEVHVIDTGVGISSDVMPQLFRHGFTTRKAGHGFGLHSCALAAQELGGSLSAQSDGRGQGATFVLRLPVSFEVESAAQLASSMSEQPASMESQK